MAEQKLLHIIRFLIPEEYEIHTICGMVFVSKELPEWVLAVKPKCLFDVCKNCSRIQ